MLERYRAAYDSAFKDDKLFAPTAGRIVRTSVIVERSTIGACSPTFTEPIQCPQPWRPTSPTQHLKKRPSRRCITTDQEREREACLEIQQILFQQAQEQQVASSATATSSWVGNEFFPIDRPSANRAMLFNTPTIDPHGTVDNDQNSRLIFNDSDSNVSLHNDGDAGSLRDSHGSLRLVLSRSPIPGRCDPLEDLPYETVVTPPIRSHNPITMNSPFCYGVGCEGAEIGLLSFSPPINEYLPSLMDRRSRITSSPNTNDYYNKKRFGDANSSKLRRRKTGSEGQQQSQNASKKIFPHVGDASFSNLPPFEEPTHQDQQWADSKETTSNRAESST